MYFIDVILPLSLPNTFTYAVGQDEWEFLKEGIRVSVPFGKMGVYTAIVVNKHHQEPQKYKAKNIYEILDNQPMYTQLQLKLWFWVAEYYMCNIGDVYRMAVPSSLLLENETLVVFDSQKTVEVSSLSDKEYLLYEAFQRQSILTITEIINILNDKKIFPVVESFIEKGLVYLHAESKEIYKPKMVKFVRLSAHYNQKDKLQEALALVSRYQKQKAVLLNYFQIMAMDKKALVTVKQLAEKSDVSTSVVRSLIEKNILEEVEVQIDRVAFAQKDDSKITLTPYQQKACDEVEQLFEQKQVVLIDAVAGAGKTEIYIQQIEKTLQAGRDVLYLLPELAVTVQLVQRLSVYFGNKLLVYNASYSINERTEVWKKIKESQQPYLVIGSRSSVFLPFSNLGLVVVDEEHDFSYKQFDRSPKFHARDVSIVLAKYHKAKVLLGSATPSLDSFYNTYRGKYGKVELKTRFGNTLKPEYLLVDLREAYRKKQMIGHFSQKLIDEINESLQKNEQVILFQNRRGFSPIMECISCGETPQCTNCDVSLTYYKTSNSLKCHYCGYSIPKPNRCVKCGSVDIYTKGFGTEQIELELKELFPHKKIARMDLDTTRGRNAIEKILNDFKRKDIDILVGTQMISKGLEFDNVTLVGILNADGMLHFPDFRSHERAYQLIEQVAGRAGKADKRGKVVVQTYNVYHNIIQQLINNDYPSMFQEQMYDRYHHKYPPFFKIITIQLKYSNYHTLSEASKWLAKSISNNVKAIVLGPEDPFISRIKNKYIKQILIKIPVETSLKNTKQSIIQQFKKFETIAAYRGIKISVNVDW